MNVITLAETIRRLTLEDGLEDGLEHWTINGNRLEYYGDEDPDTTRAFEIKDHIDEPLAELYDERTRIYGIHTPRYQIPWLYVTVTEVK